MNAILILGILLIVFSFISRNKPFPYWGFVIVFIIMALQDGVEGDFMGYKESYEIFARGQNGAGVTAENDYAWIFLNQLFSQIMPFWGFIIIISGLECYVLYKSSKVFGSKKYGWVAPILFFFTFNMMLIQMKALRQGLATEIILLAFYLSTCEIKLSRSVLYGTLLVVIAFFVHKTSMIIIPYYMLFFILSQLGYFKKDDSIRTYKPSITFPLLITGAYFFVYTLKSTSLGIWLTQLALISDSNNIQFANYLLDGQNYEMEVSWLIVLYNGIMVFLCSWFMQRTTRLNKFFAIASIIGCFGEMLLFGMASLPRICMFFLVYDLFTYPHIVEMIEKRYGKVPAYLLIAFLVGYAVKTSLPWITYAGDDRFGSYHFFFM